MYMMPFNLMKTDPSVGVTFQLTNDAHSGDWHVRAAVYVVLATTSMTLSILDGD